MTTNYEDERLTSVEAEKQAALSEVEKTYGSMISQSDEYFQKQIDASQKWADQQTQIQQEQTDFAIEQIEQQEEQAKKDYTKEQSGAYVDWKKQSSQYGANAEQLAAVGMAGTGFSESSQVGMYNTYQNRVATARESLNAAVLNFTNAIKEARLNNSSAQAEIALQAFQKQAELALQGFQYKNQLVLALSDKKSEVEATYHNRYQDVLSQINAEKALAEEARQFDLNLQEEQRQFDAQMEASGNGGLIDKYEVNTDYYQGALNSDAKTFGVFSNGYQPKGITGHGKVSKTGETVELTLMTLDGRQVTKTQNAWKAEDGTLWYWNGAENMYIQLTEKPKTSGSSRRGSNGNAGGSVRGASFSNSEVI